MTPGVHTGFLADSNLYEENFIDDSIQKRNRGY